MDDEKEKNYQINASLMNIDSIPIINEHSRKGIS